MSKQDTLYFLESHAFAAFSAPGASEYKLVCSADRSYSEFTTLSTDQYIIAPYNMAAEKSIYAISVDEVHNNVPFEFANFNLSDYSSTTKAEYERLFTLAMDAISNTDLQKVILSRRIVFEASIDPVNIFHELRLIYPNAYVFIYHLPGKGLWVGASPEVLIERTGAQTFRSVALAGTQGFSGKSINQTTWANKEIKEQSFIVQYVEEVFAGLDVCVEVSEAKTVKAGNVLHIANELALTTNLPLISLVQILHPGPALSGYPKNLAMDFINREETHDREFYCGFMGRVSDQYADLYINLRSMKVTENQFILFVGGGITAESKCEDEWVETEQKSLTLRSVIDASLISHPL